MFLSNMAPQKSIWPNDEAKILSNDFWKKSECGIPAVIGNYNTIYSIYILKTKKFFRLDRWHNCSILFDPPHQRKDDYIDSKGNVSLILQTVCNEYKKCIDIFGGYPGSCHDCSDFKNSPLFINLDKCCGSTTNIFLFVYNFLIRVFQIAIYSACPCLKKSIEPVQ